MFKLYDGRERFYQWDSDRKVIVADAAINEVHFCNKTDDCSLVCETYELDGVLVADVPNILLQDDWRINVYAFDKNYTKYSAVFEVVSRTKPDDYVYTETETVTLVRIEELMREIEANVTDYAQDYMDTHKEEFKGEPGAPGAQGERGNPGVYVGTAEPADVEYKVWINPEGDEFNDELATKAYVDDAIANIEVGGGVDLTGYATEQYVNDAISAIELLPGEPGIPGEDGKDYVLTDADKQEIASLAIELLPVAEGGSF